MKTILHSIVVSILLFFFLFHAVITRAESFSLSMKSEYSFVSTGTATVKKIVTLSNLTTNNYASIFILDLPDDARDVHSFDTNGKVTTTLLEDLGKKRVKVNLTKEAIGFGTQATFVLTFVSDSFYDDIGNSERIITIPGFSSPESIESYTVSVLFPKDWQQPTRIIPAYDTPYTWDLTKRPDAQISFVFGSLHTPAVQTSTNKTFPGLLLIGGFSLGIVLFALLFSFGKRMHTFK